MCSHIFEAFPAQTLLLPIVYEAFPAQPIHLLPESAGFSFFRPFLHSRYSYFAISCHISKFTSLQLRFSLQKTFLTRHCTNSTPHQQKLRHKHWRHDSRRVTATASPKKQTPHQIFCITTSCSFIKLGDASATLMSKFAFFSVLLPFWGL